jgi:hypothetical protein
VQDPIRHRVVPVLSSWTQICGSPPGSALAGALIPDAVTIDRVDEERFVTGLAAALPEAFADRDVRDEYYVDYDDSWLTYPALGDARMWLEEHAIRISLAARQVAVLPGGEDRLRRFFAYMEEVAAGADDDERLANLLMIELFEGVVWTEDVIEYLGPRTRALLEDARVLLADANHAIGRWPEPKPPKRRRPRHR